MKGMIDTFTVLLNSVLRWELDGIPVPAHSERMTLQAEMVYPSHSVGYQKVKLWVFVMIICAVFMLSGTGCALHHYDKATGTEHIWGFGHMKMKISPANEGLQAIVRGTDVLGVSLGIGQAQSYFTVGWHNSQRLDVIAESTSVRYEWPDSDFVNVGIGSEFPLQEQDTPESGK